MCKNIFVILAHFIILFSLGEFPSAVLWIPGMIKDKVFICASTLYTYIYEYMSTSIDVHINTVHIFGRSFEITVFHTDVR